MAVEVVGHSLVEEEGEVGEEVTLWLGLAVIALVEERSVEEVVWESVE